MSLDSRDISILSQVSAKVAADLAIAARDVSIKDLLSDYALALPDVADAIIQLINEKVAEAAFPGSVDGTGAPAPWAPSATPAAPTTASAPPVAPAPIPGVTDGDPATAARWQDLAANTSEWQDNRADKASGKAPANVPDFKHKTRKAAGSKYNDSLYLDDKKNPSWVPQLVATLRF